MRPAVSIILVSWNTRELTLDALASIGAAAGDVRCEVIVVDNGSRDRSREALAAVPSIELIANALNRGYAAAVNQAYARARGEFVLLLNSDVRLTAGSLETLVRFLEARPGAAGVAARYVGVDGSPRDHYHRLPSFAAAVALATGLRRLPPFARAHRRYLMCGESFSRPRPVAQPSASCLLLRRAHLPAERVFDESYPIYFNDVELARRLGEQGHELWMTPEAVAIHEPGASTALLGSVRSRHHLASLVRYVRSTQPRPRVWLFSALVLVDKLVRRLTAREDSLPLSDLAAVLRGRPGPPPESPGTWVIYQSGIPWHWHRNRQQELASQLAGDRRVLFVEPPRLRPRLRLRVEQLAPSLWRAAPPAPLPLGRHLPPANNLNRALAARSLRRWLDRRTSGRRLLWIDEDLAAPMIGRLRESACIYDAADLDWTFTRPWNRHTFRRALARAVEGADLVLVSSRALPAALPAPKAAPITLPNAADTRHFKPTGPESGSVASLPRPRVGYVGAIDERAFDATLIAAAAGRRPDWAFVLAGPVTRHARSTLKHLSNVHLLGPVDYEDVPALIRGFDVCLIPYRRGGLVDYVQPKKLYEYLAAGKPVVATDLRGLEGLEAPLRRVTTAEEFVVAVEASLDESRPDLVRRRRACAESNTWDQRGELLRRLVGQLETSVV